MSRNFSQLDWAGMLKTSYRENSDTIGLFMGILILNNRRFQRRLCRT
ncbi:MAG: hypothetical protein HOP02_07400 [Methylococcaceae bacterium]|nr:hypothetical protein [Methylococcaceae bacterium]